jgi:aspartate carbamoyltransferase catalytic subunit
VTSHHFLAANHIDFSLLQLLLQKTQFYSEQKYFPKMLEHVTVANLFFENSTRTRCSFEIAAKKLGAHVINLDVNHSSMTKGETILDTLLTLESLGVDISVVRHSEENILNDVASKLKMSLVNAGTGKLEHPSQALLDLFTIQQEFKTLNGLNIAICGDIKHSRVATSFIQMMSLFHNSKIFLCGPNYFLPTSIPANCETSNIDQIIDQIDVVMLLRVQIERHQGIELEQNYLNKYGLTHERQKKMHAKSIIMHPAPVNRGVEIEHDLVQHAQSRILKQSENGVFARMAILDYIWHQKIRG